MVTEQSVPRWNSRYVGQALENHVIVGNPTRPFSMSTSCMTTFERTRWGLWFQANTSSTYGESISRFSSEFFAPQGSSSRLVFSGWNPTYLRTTYFVHNTIHITHRITYFTHIYHSRVWWTILQKEGVLWHSSTYWYAQNRFSTYLVRACTICFPGLPVSHPPGFITRGFTYSSFTFILESHSIIVLLSKISYIFIPMFLYYFHPANQSSQLAVVPQ